MSVTNERQVAPIYVNDLAEPIAKALYEQNLMTQALVKIWWDSQVPLWQEDNSSTKDAEEGSLQPATHGSMRPPLNVL